MSIKIKNFQLFAGSDSRIAVKVNDTEGLPYDLSRYTCAMQLREDYNSPAVDTLTTENGRIELSKGCITLIFTKEATSKIAKGVFLYDLELSSGNLTTRILQGKIKIIQEVTKIDE